jgi:hypothetical protein
MRLPFGKLGRNRRGGATVAIAVVMSMVLVISFVQDILLYDQVMRTEDRDRLNEQIEIEKVWFDVGYKLHVDVRNVGSVPARIIALWIKPDHPAKETARYKLGLYLGVEELKDVLPDDLVLDPPLSMLEEFTVTAFTERGNSGSSDYSFASSGGEEYPEVGEMGVFRVDWFFCKYSSEQYPTIPLQSPPGVPVVDAVLIEKSDDYVAFFLKIKNIWDRPCAIMAESVLTLPALQPSSGHGEPNFFVARSINYDVADPAHPEITEAYNNTEFRYVVHQNQTQVIIFVAKDLGSDVWRWPDGYPFGTETTTEVTGIQISLVYEVYKLVDDEWVPAGDIFGQTIATQACVIEKK